MSASAKSGEGSGSVIYVNLGINTADTVHVLSVSNGCEHKNGWYVTVRFFLWEKRIFVCSDCGESTDKKLEVSKWKPWFAWFPVRLDDGRLAWLRWIKRKKLKPSNR